MRPWGLLGTGVPVVVAGVLAAAAWAATDETVLVSHAPGAMGNKGEAPSLSADGRFVVFTASSPAVHPELNGSSYDVVVRDLQTATTTLVSRATGAAGAKSSNSSWDGSISADGRLVAFHSIASNLHPDDPDGNQDVFVRDLLTNTTTLVSRASGAAGAKSNDQSSAPSISANGRYVAFTSGASNLHPDDTGADLDVFVRDLQTDTTTLVSRADGAPGAEGNRASQSPAISDDGRFVAFLSEATNLHPDDTDTVGDMFVRDLQANTTTLVSRATGTAGTKAANVNPQSGPAISGDGRFVAFATFATNLVPGDSGQSDVFVRDVQAATTTLVSRAPGATGAKGNHHSFDPTLSADGRLVTFTSTAANLHPDDPDYTADVFVRDLQTDAMGLVSRATGATGAKGNGASQSYPPSISGDGRFVAFASAATNLHPDDTDSAVDVFRRELGALTLPAPAHTPVPTPVPARVVPALKLSAAAATINLRTGRGRLAATCTAEPGDRCKFSGTLRTRTKPSKRVGRATATIASGRRGRMTIRLDSRGRSLLKRRGRLRVRLAGTVADSTGKRASVRGLVTLKAKRR